MNGYLASLADTALAVPWTVWLGLILGSITAHYAQQDRDQQDRWEPTHITVEVEAVQS